MPSFRHAEIIANYIDEGDGDPIVLLHAGGSSGRQWRNIVARLSERFRCIAPDLIGFGQTLARLIHRGPDFGMAGVA